MFDTKTEKIPGMAAADASSPIPMTSSLDKNGDAWTGGMATDRIVRLDPKTGKRVEYPLPRDTNMRRMFVDNSTTPADVLGRQQPRRLDREGRAAGLMLPTCDRRNWSHGISTVVPAQAGTYTP